MSREIDSLSDETMPREIIDEVRQWVEDAFNAAMAKWVSPGFPRSGHISTECSDIYREHFGKLRGEPLVQYSRAVFRWAHAWRRRHGALYREMYNCGIRQRHHDAEQAYARQVILEQFTDNLLKRKLPLTSDLVDDALRLVTDNQIDWARSVPVMKLVEQFAASGDLSATSLALLNAQFEYWKNSHYSTFSHVISRLISPQIGPPLQPGDAWADAALAELAAFPDEARQNWCRLLVHAATVGPTKANRKWRTDAAQILNEIDPAEFHRRASAWLRLIGESGTLQRKIRPWNDATDNTRLDDTNAIIAMGLVWMLADTGGDVSVLSRVARASFKRIAQGQLRCEQLGNAVVHALGTISGETGISQLAQLEILIRAPKPLRLIRKTLQEAAEREGVAVADLAETAVPDLGIHDGRITRQFGDFAAVITPVGEHVRISWVNADGEQKRVIPKQLKTLYPDAQNEIKQFAQQHETLLPAQRARIERLMKSTRRWSMHDWRTRYFNHPLVSLIARRLIWTINDRPVLVSDERIQDVCGVDVTTSDEDHVQLWHPIGRDVAEVLAWRDRLETLQITQPFKQAHREIYVLTDAERRTSDYSNRFAAHILKNTTMVALCQVRGWVTGLFGGQTGPRLDLPDFGVRAEFWVEPAGDDYTDFGAPLYVSTDQVRFYPLTLADAERLGHSGGLIEPLSLERVPPRALTEAMRDVDLFIGLASVGNDPNWNDGGANGRYRDYWHSYSFGELNESAKTRRDALRRIIPRLDIADRCQLSDKFLRVTGQSRAYKIHLGSANILMEPNDQYLCIVPDRRSDERGSQVFLPFDGDRTLSIILSKALMLADDTKITDPTIISQIRSR